MSMRIHAASAVRARDRSIRCDLCDECKPSGQLIYCEGCRRPLCFAHGKYDCMKKEERKRFYPGSSDENYIDLRFGKCDTCIARTKEEDRLRSNKG